MKKPITGKKTFPSNFSGLHYVKFYSHGERLISNRRRRFVRNALCQSVSVASEVLPQKQIEHCHGKAAKSIPYQVAITKTFFRCERNNNKSKNI